MTSTSQAAAGAFMVDPIRLTLSEKKPSAVLRVENRSDTTVTLQLQAMHWRQDSGGDQLSVSHDLLATPQVFRLRPGQLQVVRVALLKPVDQQRELSYRLLLDEVPPAPGPEFRGLQMALRISMPIFIEPREASAPADPCGAALVERGGQRLLVLANRSFRHLQLNGFRLTAGASSAPATASSREPSSTAYKADPGELLAHEQTLYLLPGQQRELPVPTNLGLARGQPLMLRAQTPTGVVECHVPASSH